MLLLVLVLVLMLVLLVLLLLLLLLFFTVFSSWQNEQLWSKVLGRFDISWCDLVRHCMLTNFVDHTLRILIFQWSKDWAFRLQNEDVECECDWTMWTYARVFVVAAPKYMHIEICGSLAYYLYLYLFLFLFHRHRRRRIYLDLCLFSAHTPPVYMFVFIFRQWPCEIWSVLSMRNGFLLIFRQVLFQLCRIFAQFYTAFDVMAKWIFVRCCFGCIISVRTAQIVDCCNIRSLIPSIVKTSI